MDSVSLAGNRDRDGGSSTSGQSLAATVERTERALALSAEPSAQPALVMLCGLPGTGKSYLARRLQPYLGAVVIETDRVRRFLFSSPTHAAGESGRVYAVCHGLIERHLRRRHSVIFDATNLQERSRQRVYRLAGRLATPLVVVRTVAPAELVWRRMAGRAARADPDDRSQADFAVFLKLAPSEEPVRRPHIVVDTAQDVEQALQRIVEACRVQETAMKEPYTVRDHTADIALDVRGQTLEELFENAATGMFAQMVDVRRLPLVVQRTVHLEEPDNEALLVAWLSELLYLREVHGEAYSRFAVHFARPGVLDGVARGAVRRRVRRPIKAVTYHGLKIEQTGREYRVSIVFDV